MIQSTDAPSSNDTTGIGVISATNPASISRLPDRASKSRNAVAFPLQDHTGRSREERAPCILRLMFDKID